MKNIMLIILFALSACQSSDNNPNIVESQPSHQTDFIILALGDSLTEGLGVDEMDNYPSVLQRSLPKNIKIINAGLSGETSSGLINRLDWVLSQKPNLTILNIGANDAMRGLPLELTTNNIDEIINKIKQADSDVILVGMQIYNNLGKEYVTGFKDIYPKLAHKHNLPLIPFFLAHVAGNPELNQADMLHPNAKGYEIIVSQNILPIITQYLSSIKQ